MGQRNRPTSSQQASNFSISKKTAWSSEEQPQAQDMCYAYVANNDKHLSIIFIHGLTGGRERTWTAKEASSPWPKTLLPLKFPESRILTFGYDAHVTQWRGVVSQSRIAHHAWKLLTALSTYREEDDTNERRIIFVCHSLGGLVCEDALVTSKQRSEPHLHGIIRSTRGIIFLGTPHHGAGLARWAEMLAKAVGHIKQANPKVVQVLQRDSEVLARIQYSFHTIIMTRNKEGNRNGAPPIEITCFYEELPPARAWACTFADSREVGACTKPHHQVVPQHSAILPGYIPIVIHANHMDMAKFDSVEDPGFVAMCGELRRWLKGLKADVDVNIAAVADTSGQQMSHARVPFWSVGETPECTESLQSCWLVPFGRNRDFVGRQDMLESLLKVLPPRADEDNCQRTVIEGLCGVGKTQIALQAAFRTRDRYPDCSVFWVPAVDALTFENSCRDIGRQLKVKGVDDDKADVGLLVKTALSEGAGRWLLIVDNADDVELLFGNAGAGATPLVECLPFNRNGSILFTTRNHEVTMRLDISPRHSFTTGEMRRDEAVKMLQRHLTESQTRDAESINVLLDFLTDLPLAIRQASAYISKTGMSVAKYLQHCQSSDSKLVTLLSKDFVDRNRYKNIKNPVTTTWLISF
ncbi:sesB-related regulatory protein [Metarhizium guizhouense ARSEF 977]|uniref:SesB-related regulatory protein n=1 Tax=Metarhizium guizhouense (strain ARSEF 977) TaxID=1276136 RepID=A0A0B4GFJ2_METGA|nr:sesB-related regulatory protein [Metarhizium guizhouense ARSEF 977]